MASVAKCGQMVQDMKDTGKVIKQTVKGSTSTEMAKFTKVYGWMICSMGTDGKKCLMGVHLKGNLRGVARMVTVYTDGLIKQCTRVSGNRAR